MFYLFLGEYVPLKASGPIVAETKSEQVCFVFPLWFSADESFFRKSLLRLGKRANLSSQLVLLFVIPLLESAADLTRHFTRGVNKVCTKTQNRYVLLPFENGF